MHERGRGPEQLADVDAIVIPGGFGVRGVDGKVGALRHARTHGLPALGLCLGMQSMVIEYARTELGLSDAHSTEFAPDTAHPVIATMAEQEDIVAGSGDLGGTMRLGAYAHTLAEDSLAAQVYGATEVSERHRHRYEVNNAYRDRLEAAGLRISGVSELAGEHSLVEFVELDPAVHPFYIGTQAHPELKSRPTRAHPLFAGLIGAALEIQKATRLLEVAPDGTVPELAGDEDGGQVSSDDER